MKLHTFLTATLVFSTGIAGSDDARVINGHTGSVLAMGGSGGDSSARVWNVSDAPEK